MKALSFWQQKIVQFFHDPPGKAAMLLRRGAGKHEDLAMRLFSTYTGLPLRYVPRYSDWISAGADRPVLTPPRARGVRPLQVHWYAHPSITHPLATPGHSLRLPGEAEDGASLSTREIAAGKHAQEQVAGTLARRGGTSVEPGADETGAEDEADAPERVDDAEAQRQRTALESEFGPQRAWQDPDGLKRGHRRLWRRFRDDLAWQGWTPGQRLVAHALWEEMPGETRCPDHSIWDHLRMATALCFVNDEAGKLPQAQNPWFLSFSLGPVGAFIDEARTTRDLWVGSFLLSDLIWHAMMPIIEAYGPDAILYPDLRANPRADVWLWDEQRDALPAWLGDNPQLRQGPCTFASVLPNTFTALVPEGGAGDLRPFQEIAEDARRAVEKRWQELASLVHGWLRDKIEPGPWAVIWQRQHSHLDRILQTTWSAVPWRPLEKLDTPASLRGDSLPAQVPREPADPADAERLRERRQRLAPWMPRAAWAHYERVREVYAHTNLAYHQLERGFDYALAHHQLRVQHALRKATAADAPIEGEPGEKCTLCGKRQALTNATGLSGDREREKTREFWTGHSQELEGEEAGKERLCGVCTMKRCLVKAGVKDGKLAGLNPIWAGPGAGLAEVADRDNIVRVPFPSSATLAAQEFLADIVTDPSMQGALAAVTQAARAAHLPRTSRPRALPRLAAADEACKRAKLAAGREFLKYEAEEVLFPEAVQARIRRAEGDLPAFGRLHEAVKALREQARERHGAPGTRIAVLRMDGDSMGKLLLGDGSVLRARFEDVIHPKLPEKIRAHEQLRNAGWPDLLESTRPMGPALHAFISRALGHFSHRVVPWVVEREFSGRLIYAGGDDVLALVPEADALPMAARLMQLYSAPWVTDTDFQADAWSWRRSGGLATFDAEQARRRFVPLRRSSRRGDSPELAGEIRWGRIDEDCLARHVDSSERASTPRVCDGSLLPMLGPCHSLSAGIVYAHYKTPMRGLLKQSKDLEKQAKRSGRAAVAFGYRSRGGDKVDFALRWLEPLADGGEEQPLGGFELLRRVRDGFREGRLASRLPYKLRELAPRYFGALSRDGREQGADEAERRALARGLFAQALEGDASGAAAEAAFQLFWLGLEAVRRREENDPARDEADVAERRRREAHAVSGLVLCRALGGAEEDA